MELFIFYYFYHVLRRFCFLTTVTKRIYFVKVLKEPNFIICRFWITNQLFVFFLRKWWSRRKTEVGKEHLYFL